MTTREETIREYERTASDYWCKMKRVRSKEIYNNEKCETVGELKGKLNALPDDMLVLTSNMGRDMMGGHGFLNRVLEVNADPCDVSKGKYCVLSGGMGMTWPSECLQQNMIPESVFLSRVIKNAGNLRDNPDLSIEKIEELTAYYKAEVEGVEFGHDTIYMLGSKIPKEYSGY
jgi:hypothetical protein